MQARRAGESELGEADWRAGDEWNESGLDVERDSCGAQSHAPRPGLRSLRSESSTLCGSGLAWATFLR